MDSSDSSNGKGSRGPRSPSDERILHRRIRNRRESMGMAANELARHARVSPSYVSLIEKGAKVPSGPVALRIAKALDDDPKLYLAWVSSSRVEDVESAYRSLDRARRYRRDPHLRARVESGQDVHDLLAASDAAAETEAEVDGVEGPKKSPAPASSPVSPSATLASSERRLRAAQAFRKASVVEEVLTENDHPSSRTLGDRYSLEPEAPLPLQETREASRALWIPVLPTGADPGETGIPAELVIGRVPLDTSLQQDAATGRLFAYRLDESSVERVRDRFSAGDLVVLTSETGPLQNTSIYAVRHSGGIRLSRVAVKARTLFLLPSPEGGELEVIELRRASRIARHIAGRVLLSIRAES